jgi:hypothetical protein
VGWRSVIFRVGQNRIYTPYMTVYLVVFLPKIPYIYRIYMVLANSSYFVTQFVLQNAIEKRSLRNNKNGEGKQKSEKSRK